MSGPGGQPLTPVERAIIESIRRGEPDAEICARLGISIVDVKHKVEVLKQRFGVDERAALGGVDPDVAPASLEEEDESSTKRLAPPGTEDNFRDRFTQAAAADAPVHSRRAVLGALFAGGATVAGAGVYYLLGGGEQRSPASRDPFATPTPTPTPAPAPTPTPHPGLASLEPMRGAWTRRTYSSGETLELLHGIGFIDTETGEMEVFQAGMLRSIDTRPGYLVRPDGINGRAFTARYMVSPGNTLLAVEQTGGAHGESSLLNRATGESHVWDAGALSLSLLDDELLIFAHTDFASGLLRPPRPTGGFDVVNRELERVSGFELRAAARMGVSMTLSGDRSHILVTAGTELFIVEMASGAVARVHLPDTNDGRPLHPSAVEPLGAEAFRVLAQPVSRQPSERPASYELTIHPGGQVGDLRAIGRLRPRLPGQVSPDGRYRAQQGTLRTLLTHTGSQEDWLYTEVFDDEANRPLFRVRSGQLWYGRTGRRWLADSSAFVVESVDVSREMDASAPHRPRTYYLVEPGDTGAEMRMLALPPEAASLGRPADPEPSPDNFDLVSLGGVLAWERSSGRVLGPADPPSTLPINPWSAGSREMRFVFGPVLPSVANDVPTLLPPLVELPPYGDKLAFAVAADTECLELQGYPSSHARTIDCVPGGSALSLNPLEEPPEPIPGYSGMPARAAAVHDNPNDAIRYVRVTRDGRDHGWVDIRYLEWA